ncbi:nck-associated protein 5, variant 2 [Chamberlinius hualienensis]
MIGIFCRKWKPKRSNGPKKLKEKGDNRDGASDVFDGSDTQKDNKSPVTSNKAGHQVYPESRSNEKYNSMISLQGKHGGSPLLSHGFPSQVSHPCAPSELMDNNKSEGRSEVDRGKSREDLSRDFKKGNSLPAGVAPPPYNSEELLLYGDDSKSKMINRKEPLLRMTTSVTSPLLSSSKNVSNWDSPVQLKRRTIANGQEQYESARTSEGNDTEKQDPAKECAEKRIQLEVELGANGEHEHVSDTATASIHDSYNNRFKLPSKNSVDLQELERERLLRQAAEEKLKEVTFEKDSYKEQLACLQEEIMKKGSDGCSENHPHRESNPSSRFNMDSKYERKLQNCQLNAVRLGKVNSLLVKEIRNLESVMSSTDQGGIVDGETKTNKALLERLKYLEAENSSLVLESEQQRMLYERCLDDVANQVVQALLVQKSLQETCSKLKKRVDDLEQQNRTLHILFQQQLHRTWDPRSNKRNASTSYQEIKVGNVSPILPDSTNSQFLHVGKKMVRSSSSSTSCSQSSSSSSSSGGRRSPMAQSGSSDGSITSDYSPMSITGKGYQGGRPSGFIDERRLSPSVENGVSSETGSLCWRDFCSVCKEGDCCRDDCCSACSCSAPPAKTFSQKEQISSNYFLPYIKERRHPPHGPVMGMTDLLRLNNRKAEVNAGVHFDSHQRWNNKVTQCGDKEQGGDVEMRLDSMTTPSDDGQLSLYKNLDVTNLHDRNATTFFPCMTAGNLKPNLKYKLSEDASNGTVTTSWRGSCNTQCYKSALNNYQNTTPSRSAFQRPHHLKLCKHYTLPSNLKETKPIPYDRCSFKFDKLVNSFSSEETAKNSIIKVDLVTKPNNSVTSDSVTGNHVNAISANNYGNESGLESSETSPKDSLLCSSVSEDQDDSTSKKSGAKDEGYSTMSSDIQCDGEVDDQSRRASINVSPDFLCYESSVEPKFINFNSKLEVGSDLLTNVASQDKEETAVQNSSQSESSVAITVLDKTSTLVHNIAICEVRDDDVMINKTSQIGKKFGALSSLKENNERGTAFGSLSLLAVKVGHVESIKEKFELESKSKRESDVSKCKEMEAEYSVSRSGCKCVGSDAVLNCTSSEKLLHKPHIIVGDDADVFFLPIYCPLTSDESTHLKPVEYIGDILKRSKSDSCLYPGRGINQLCNDNLHNARQRHLKCFDDIACHRSAWNLTDNFDDDIMALYRSKPCLSLAEETSQLGYLSSPLDMAEIGWPSSFSPTSLNSLHSLCSGSGEASFLHEAPASRSKLSPVSIESSCLFSSNDEDEINTSDDAWFLVDSVLSDKEFPTPLSETAVSYNEEEICNWSLNYSSEDICPRRIPDDQDWDQFNGYKRPAMSSLHTGLYPRPTDSLPSIQEVDDDDGESFISLPSNRHLIENSNKCADKRGRNELRGRIRRKEGTCNSWPSSTDRSSKVWCRANIFMDQLSGHHPSLPLPNSDSIQSWGSSIRCVSDDLSDGQAKDLSVSSFGVASGYASTSDSKSSADHSLGALEENDASPLETRFTRDFYRLCKVESCRSLDVSCKSLTNSMPREVRKVSLFNDNDLTSVTSDKNISSERASVRIEESENAKIPGEAIHIIENITVAFPDKTPDKNIDTVALNVDDQKLIKDELSVFNNHKEEEIVDNNLEKQSSPEMNIRKEGCTTSWVHFEADVDLSDPKARANLLDSMLASSTSSSDTEGDSDIADDDYKYQHLHEIHRVRRFRRAFDRDQCVVRYVPPMRPSILDRKDFFYRFGEKEKEAVASFDFLESMSTSVSDVGSMETLDGKKDVEDLKSSYFNRFSFKPSVRHDSNRNSFPNIISKSNHYDRLCKNRVEVKSNIYESSPSKISNLALPQDGDAADRISFGDSCAESFSCSYTSLNMEL